MAPKLRELRLAQGSILQWANSNLGWVTGLAQLPEKLGWIHWFRRSGKDVAPAFSEACFKSQLGIQQRPSTRAVEGAWISESEWCALFLGGLWWWAGLDRGFELPAHGS